MSIKQHVEILEPILLDDGSGERMDTVLEYYINMNLDTTDGIKITEDSIYTV